MTFTNSVIQFIGFHTPLLLFACLKASIAGSTLALAGFALTPSRLVRRLDLNGFDFFAVGTAIFIACCWIAVTHGHSVTPVVTVLLAGPPLVLLVRCWRRQCTGGDMIAAAISRLVPAIRPLLLFNLFCCVLYPLHYWQLHSDMLPIVYSGNLDLYQYGNGSMYVLHMPSLQGNVAGYDFQQYATTDSFGSFALLSILQFLPHRGPLDFAIPAMLLATGGICLVVFFSLRQFFGLGNAVATLLIVLFCANPLAWYIVYNFFFSQLIATLLLLVLFYGTLQRSLQPNPSELRQVAAAMPFYLAQFFCYPGVLLLTFAVHGTTMLISCIARHDTSILRNICNRKVILSAARIALLLPATLLLICLAFPTRAELVWTRLHVETAIGLAGWPLGLISPLVVAGLGGAGRGLVDQSSFAVAAYVVILAASIAVPWMLYVQRGSVREDARAAFTAGVTFAILLAAYLAFYLLVGPSYQQWKFASYAPQAFNWIAVAELFALYRYVGRHLAWLQRFVPGFGIAAIALAIVLDLEVSRTLPAVQVTSGIETMSAIDQMPIERVALDATDGTPSNLDYAIQTAAPSYIRRPELYMTWGGLAYPTVLPESYHPSADFPLLTNTMNCGSAESGGVLRLRDGFEVVMRDYLPIGTTIDFHHRYCFGLFAASGTGVSEPSGRWTDGHETRFRIRIDPAQLPGDLLVSLVATPFTAPGAPEQEATVSVNSRKLAVWRYSPGGQRQFDLLISHALATERPELEIALQLPNAVSLLPYSHGADRRVVALMLDTLTLRNAPADVAQMPTRPDAGLR
jgi:hypothetical protein